MPGGASLRQEIAERLAEAAQLGEAAALLGPDRESELAAKCCSAASEQPPPPAVPLQRRTSPGGEAPDFSFACEGTLHERDRRALLLAPSNALDGAVSSSTCLSPRSRRAAARIRAMSRCSALSRHGSSVDVVVVLPGGTPSPSKAGRPRSRAAAVQGLVSTPTWIRTRDLRIRSAPRHVRSDRETGSKPLARRESSRQPRGVVVAGRVVQVALRGCVGGVAHPGLYVEARDARSRQHGAECVAQIMESQWRCTRGIPSPTEGLTHRVGMTHPSVGPWEHQVAGCSPPLALRQFSQDGQRAIRQRNGSSLAGLRPLDLTIRNGALNVQRRL